MKETELAQALLEVWLKRHVATSASESIASDGAQGEPELPRAPSTRPVRVPSCR
ncbi:MAG: hypothetical protein RJA98_938, partial [Pseudomonadota bacterium]